MTKIRMPFILKDKDLKRIIKEAKKPQFKLAIMMGAFLGLRVFEITHSKITDIDFKNKLFIVRPEISKYDKGGLIPIPECLYNYLLVYTYKYNTKIKENQNYLIFNDSNRLSFHYHPVNLTQNYRKILKRLNLHEIYYYDKKFRPRYKYSFHGLRRYYATKLYNSTRDIYFVSSCLRHSSISATEIYTQLNPSLKKELVNETFKDNIAIKNEIIH